MGLPAIHHRVFIATPPALVFEALSTPERLDQWFTTESRVEHTGGGCVEFIWRDYGVDHADVRDGGPILAMVPSRELAFEWHPATNPTTVTLTLEPQDEGTVLELVEKGYENTPEDEETLIQVAVGWGEALTYLKVYLEYGIAYGGSGR